MRTDTSRRGAPPAPAQAGAPRLMWITPERVFYAGLLGAPSMRTMGALTVYVATAGRVHLRLDGGAWASGAVAVVPPYTPHQVASDARQIHLVQVEAEAVDPRALPAPLAARGVVEAPAFAERVHRAGRGLCAAAFELDLAALDFDRLFFGAALPARPLDRRIRSVIERIRDDPGGPASAQACAEAVHLSVSRFLHLFKRETGAPFRGFRTWKRARGLLHHVNREANLAHLALQTGYPDSTHFSHSIRAVYGLKPRDIFAGSRRLAILDECAPPGSLPRA